MKADLLEAGRLANGRCRQISSSRVSAVAGVISLFSRKGSNPGSVGVWFRDKLSVASGGELPTAAGEDDAAAAEALTGAAAPFLWRNLALFSKGRPSEGL